MIELSSPVPEVSVIIPVYNDQNGLDITLKSILEQDYPKKLYEIVVVDNGSSPNIVLPIFNNSIVRLVVCNLPGSYAARNYGVKVAKGQVFAFIDADCIASPDWLKNGANLSYSSNHPIAGKVEFYTNSRSKNTAELLQMTVGFGQSSFVYDQFFGATANLFVPRSVFFKVGEFNEQLLSGGDRYWGWMAKEKGIKIKYDPKAIVFHACRKSILSLVKQTFRVAGGRYSLSKLKPDEICKNQLKPHRSGFKALYYIWKHIPVKQTMVRIKVCLLAILLWLVRKSGELLCKIGVKPIRG